MLENTILSYLNQRGASLNWLATQINMTRSGLERAIKKETIEFRRLIEIASVLEISLFELLEDEGKESPNNNEQMKAALLEKIIFEKEKQIKDKEEIIQLLKQQIKKS